MGIKKKKKKVAKPKSKLSSKPNSKKKPDSYTRRFLRRMEDVLSSVLYFLTVTMRAESTFDWLVFLANNLGLYQEYELNDYGQRLSPRTGRPVLLSLGPLRVVQMVESANQVRSHWDPYIRDFLATSNLTTDCWRANRMALQVALCMDELGQMHDMPVSDPAIRPQGDTPAQPEAKKPSRTSGDKKED